MKLTKYQSSGSDHIVICVPECDVDDDIWVRAVSYLCDRSGPFGADGLAVVSRTSGQEGYARLRAFTPDGNEPVPCINAAMCGASALFRENDQSTTLKVACRGEVYVLSRVVSGYQHVLEVEFESATIKLSDVGSILSTSQTQLEEVLGADAGDYSDVAFFDVGTPQLQFFTPRVDEQKLTKIANRLNATGIAPDGVNVSAVGSAPSFRFIRTFERGGAGLTASCASATACGALLRSTRLHPITGVIPMVTKGGRYLVRIQKNGSSTWTAAVTGLVSPVYSTEVTSDYLEALSSGVQGVTQIRGSLYLEAISEHGKIVEDLLIDSGFSAWCS